VYAVDGQLLQIVGKMRPAPVSSVKDAQSDLHNDWVGLIIEPRRACNDTSAPYPVRGKCLDGTEYSTDTQYEVTVPPATNAAIGRGGVRSGWHGYCVVTCSY
jgi:hypothetical protein